MSVLQQDILQNCSDGFEKWISLTLFFVIPKDDAHNPACVTS
jgi:hypothetical protein